MFIINTSLINIVRWFEQCISHTRNVSIEWHGLFSEGAFYRKSSVFSTFTLHFHNLKKGTLLLHMCGCWRTTTSLHSALIPPRETLKPRMVRSLFLHSDLDSNWFFYDSAWNTLFIQHFPQFDIFFTFRSWLPIWPVSLETTPPHVLLPAALVPI